jgi:arginase
LTLIGAPTSAGAYAPGQEKAPAAFRRHGLVKALERGGRRIVDRGDVEGFRWRPDLQRPQAMNLPAVHRVAAAVADRVTEALVQDNAVLVLGGDCTVELGTVAGAMRDAGSVGLIYIDFDADLTVPSTSDGALDWTGVAHLLNVEGAALELSGLGPYTPMLQPAAVLFFATENITPTEAAIIADRGLERIGRDAVLADPAGAANQAVAWGAKFDCLLVHLDVDVLTYVDVPIAENTRRCDGLSLDALATVLGILLAAPNWRALTVTEVNPDHAPDEGETFGKLIEIFSQALSAQDRAK